MASLGDIGLAAAINILSAFAFLVAFAGLRHSPAGTGAAVSKFVNLDLRSYLKFLNWMPAALKMPEPELIEHAGLDSAVYLRIYLLGLNIFVPITLIAFAVLVPVNWTNKTLELEKLKDPKFEFNNIDKLSVSNIPEGSQRFWTHLVMAYTFTFWTCYTLYREYECITSMRLHFLASEHCRPDQFTVLVRNVPSDPDETVSELVEHFFLVNHPDQYLTNQVVYNANKLTDMVKKKKTLQNKSQAKNNSERPTTKTGFLGLWGEKVDAIEYYTTEINKLSEDIAAEREKIMSSPKSIMPAAFVSFKTRWAAAVCAQTQQTRDPTMWLTEWAPEPRDVYWHNLAMPFVQLTVRRLIIGVAFFFLTFFFMISIAFVQTLANIKGIRKTAPFLKPLIDMPVIKAFIQGFLPGIALKLFLIFLIPNTIGVSIPMKATFFITYIMVDGWAGTAGEILRLKPLIIYHLKNFFLVKTEKDREETMDAGSLGFNTGEPQIQLYFLVGLVYCVVTPFLLPYIIVFFALAYVVYRHQIINVYNQEYESAAAFWPDVHGRIITALVISQLLLMGLLTTKKAKQSTPLLIALPEAMMKDTLERAKEPNLNLKGYLQNAYIHPDFKGEDDDHSAAYNEEKEKENLVPTKRQSRRNTPLPSRCGGSSSPALSEVAHEEP
ncbi:hypothetical protein MKX01_037437 [Papaver californicum]|nr:hypothetical protein MKX01_037437 [Papaver californicum]